MASFLLVHGSWHGAWCWDRVIPLLQAGGHEVAAVDLPAHGEDRSPPWRATSMGYGARVRDAAQGLSQKPLAVGHSMGGLAITQAAAAAPDTFAGLIFLCAFAPLPGDSLFGLGRRDPGSLVSRSIFPSRAGLRIRRGRARALFYGTCSEIKAARFAEQLRHEPLRPLFQRLQRSPPAELPRAYIECTEDRAISLLRQRFLAERAGIDRVRTLESDHSPFLSTPRALCDALEDLAVMADGSTAPSS